jgi:hypothetical protein
MTTSSSQSQRYLKRIIYQPLEHGERPYHVPGPVPMTENRSNYLKRAAGDQAEVICGLATIASMLAFNPEEGPKMAQLKTTFPSNSCFLTGISTPPNPLAHVAPRPLCSGRLRPGSASAQVCSGLLRSAAFQLQLVSISVENLYIL